MKVRVMRSKKQQGDEETQVKISATTWATLIQEFSNDAWGMTDEQVVEMVNDKMVDILNYENTHDEWGNEVDAIEVRLGKVGYSVATVFDTLLFDNYEGEFCLPSC